MSNFENLKSRNHVVNLGAVGMINKKGGCKYEGYSKINLRLVGKNKRVVIA